MAVNKDPDYRLVAEKVYDTNIKLMVEVGKVQADYGKWLIATLTAVHIGASYFVGNLQGVPVGTKIAAIWWFVGGIILILLSGLTAWWNWTQHAERRNSWTNANMLINDDPKHWPKNTNAAAITSTYLLSLVFGLASAACLPIGALVLTVNLPPEVTTHTPPAVPTPPAPTATP